MIAIGVNAGYRDFIDLDDVPNWFQLGWRGYGDFIFRASIVKDFSFYCLDFIASADLVLRFNITKSFSIALNNGLGIGTLTAIRPEQENYYGYTVPGHTATLFQFPYASGIEFEFFNTHAASLSFKLSLIGAPNLVFLAGYSYLF